MDGVDGVDGVDRLDGVAGVDGVAVLLSLQGGRSTGWTGWTWTRLRVRVALVGQSGRDTGSRVEGLGWTADHGFFSKKVSHKSHSHPGL